MQIPTVSVIVPVYNVQNYLRQCVDSLLNQNMENYEIILIDDGSTDASGIICDNYEKSNNKVIVIHQNNQGVSVARNAGLKIAKGKWITFVDSDDWTDPALLCTAVNKAEDSNADILFFSYITHFENGVSSESHFIDLDSGDISDHKEYLEAKIITQFYGKTRMNSGVSAGTTWGKIIKKDLIDKYELCFPVGVIRAQDTVFWLNAVENADKIVLTNDYLYHYRLNDNNITRGKKYIKNSEDVFYKLISEYYKFVDTYNKDSQEVQDAIYIRTIQVIRWVLEHEIFNKNAGYSFIKKGNKFKALCNRDLNRKAILLGNINNLPFQTKTMVSLAKRKLYHLYIPVYALIEAYSVRKMKRNQV